MKKECVIKSISMKKDNEFDLSNQHINSLDSPNYFTLKQTLVLALPQITFT